MTGSRSSGARQRLNVQNSAISLRRADPQSHVSLLTHTLRERFYSRKLDRLPCAEAAFATARTLLPVDGRRLYVLSTFISGAGPGASPGTCGGHRGARAGAGGRPLQTWGVLSSLTTVTIATTFTLVPKPRPPDTRGILRNIIIRVPRKSEK